MVTFNVIKVTLCRTNVIIILMDTKIIVIPANELFSMIEIVLEKAESRKVEKELEKKQSENLYTINQVARRLGRAHSTIKKLASSGVLRTTPDGLISEKAINEYLKNA